MRGHPRGIVGWTDVKIDVLDCSASFLSVAVTNIREKSDLHDQIGATDKQIRQLEFVLYSTKGD